MIPWAALSFATMFFQYLDFSDAASSTIAGLSMVGSAFGGIFGGVVGDALAKWSHAHGRGLAAQVSVCLGIPLVSLLFVGIPYDAPAFVFALMCFTLGLCASWAPAACNRPVFTDIVPVG